MLQYRLNTYRICLPHPFEQSVGLRQLIPLLQPAPPQNPSTDRVDSWRKGTTASEEPHNPKVCKSDLIHTLNRLIAEQSSHDANLQKTLQHLRKIVTALDSRYLDESEHQHPNASPKLGLTARSKADSLGIKLLFALAAVGEAADIELCQQKGIDLNTVDGPDPMAPTPLMAAVKARNPATVAALLPYLEPDNLNYENANSQTALDLAKYHPSLFNQLYPLYPNRQKTLLQNLMTLWRTPEAPSEQVKLMESLTSALGD